MTPPSARPPRPARDTGFETPQALGLADLARSGLSAADARLLGMEILSAAAVTRLLPSHSGQPGLLIPYYDLRKRRRQDVFRVRFLRPPRLPFGACPVKWPRYGQPANTAPAIYLPTCVDWQAHLAERGSRVLLTEGEKKAAKASLMGLPCVGLGGVWSFMSKRLGVDLLPELEAVATMGRDIVICFDSDVAQNTGVAAAVAQLTRVLIQRGCRVRSLYLPELELGVKTGLDDYLVRRRKEDLEDLLAQAPVGELALQLWSFNDRYAVIQHPPLVYDEWATDDRGQQAPKPISPDKFKSVVCADRKVYAVEAKAAREVYVADEWLRWEGRRCYESLTYAPGQPAVLGNRLNGWLGLGVRPKRGFVSLWRELLYHLFTGAEREARVWFERWCGYPLRFLGTKLLTAVAIWSAQTGQGKTLVGDTLGRLYGANFVSIPQHTLEEDHNGWMLNKQFVLVDDVSPHDTRTRADLLKKLITQRDVLINEKFIPHFTVPDYINYYFTSNHGDAFYLDENDRRLFIHEVTVTKLDEAFYQDYYLWLDGEGPAALLHYFQHELDYGDFSPKQPPPLTRAKEEMVEGVRSEVDSWIAGLRTADLAGRELWTAAELCERFNAAAVGRRIAVNAFGRRLRRVFPTAVMVPESDGKRGRYVALRSADAWLAATPAARAAHLAKARRF